MYKLHPDVSEFAKELLKELLSHCTEEQKERFVKVYSNRDQSKTYKEVVDMLDDKYVNIAISQAEETILSNIKNFLKKEIL